MLQNKNWEKLNENEQGIAIAMKNFLEKDGYLQIAQTHVSKNGMMRKMIILLALDGEITIFPPKITKKLFSQKPTEANYFKVNDCGLNPGLQVLFDIKHALEVESKKQNFKIIYLQEQ